jgi:hypothetical protein
MGFEVVAQRSAKSGDYLPFVKMVLLANDETTRTETAVYIILWIDNIRLLSAIERVCQNRHNCQ